MVGAPGCRDADVVGTSQGFGGRQIIPARTPVGIAFGALLLAVLPILYLNIVDIRALDPVTTTISDYVSVPGGAALLAVSALSLAVASIMLPVALVRAGLPAPGVGCALFGLAGVGLLASIAFPTNTLGTAVSDSAVAHRYAAGVFFVALPLAGFWLHRRLPPSGTLGRWTAASVLTGLAFLASHIPLLFPHFPGAGTIATLLPRGLAERVLLGIDIGLLGAACRAVRVGRPS